MMQNRRKVLLAGACFLFLTGVYILKYSSNKDDSRYLQAKYISNSECSIGQIIEKPDFRIIAIAYDRAESLLKLLNSLNNALYFNDTIALEVWLDRSKDTHNVDYDTYKTAAGFKFRHGYYSVHCHKEHVGIYGQWLTTWNPSNNSQEIAVILEDDLNVSPYFYRWLKLVHRKYRHAASINGFSLQGVELKLGEHGGSGYIEPPENEVVFLYPILGAWGFSPKRENWFRCHKSTQARKFQGLIAGIKPTNWYLAKPDSMWEQWHIFCAFENEEETMFGHFPGHMGLTINRKEKGLHYSGGETADDPLLMEWRAEYEQLPDKPVHLSLDGNVVQGYDPFAYDVNNGQHIKMENVIKLICFSVCVHCTYYAN